MKKALPFAITLLFVCPVLTTTPVSANDGGKSKGSPSVLHQNHGESWLDKAWDDFLDLFRGHHDKDQDKDKGDKDKGDKDKGDKDKGDPMHPGHRGGPGSGHNANDGDNGNGGNGDNGGNGGNGNGGNGGGGNSGGGDGGGSMPITPPSGGILPSGGSSPSAPLDGGISLLLAAGVGLGVRKFFPKRGGEQK